MTSEAKGIKEAEERDAEGYINAMIEKYGKNLRACELYLFELFKVRIENA